MKDFKENDTVIDVTKEGDTADKKTVENDILNRTYKDTVFRMLFSEKEKLIELYNAIYDTNYTADTPVDINTIEEVLYKKLKNDIAFTIAKQFIVLTEHQSSISENLPLRYLIYIADIFQNIIGKRDIYKGSRLPIPSPTFIVLYNGDKDMPEQWELKLSESYLGEQQDGEELENPALELTVKVFNVNIEADGEILKKCDTLKQYSQFVSKVRGYIGNGDMGHRTMQKLVDECIREGILVDFLEKYGTSAISALCREWTDEEIKDLAREEGYEEGIEHGESRMAELHGMLLEAGRIEDLKRSIGDTEYRVQLFKEFGLE